jgi:hypothetical protein
LHQEASESFEEWIDLSIGSRAASGNWTADLDYTGGKSSVTSKLELSYPGQMVGGEKAKFAVQGNSIARIEGGPIDVWFSTEYRSLHRVSHCPGDQEQWELTNTGVGYTGPELECQLEPDELGHMSANQRRIVGRVATIVWDCVGLFPPRCNQYADVIEIEAVYKKVPDLQTTTTIQGRVYVPGEGLPLIGVPVELKHQDGGGNLTELAEVVSQEPDGSFRFYNVPETDGLLLVASLQHKARTPTTFRVYHDGDPADALAWVANRDSFTTVNAPDPLVKNLAFANVPDMMTDPAIDRDHLDDLGVLYYHTHQAWQLADMLNQPLDNQLPVDIFGFLDWGPGAWWLGPLSSGEGAGTGAIIGYDPPTSDLTDGNRPDNREWHEFGHHVMADAYANLMPEDLRPCPDPAAPGNDCSHWGYSNASTTNSWTEGFAEFYSMMVAREIDGAARPELYRWQGFEANLESNYQPWPYRSAEELAVAGLLLDLVDPVDGMDATFYGNTIYGDCIQVSLEDTLWPLLTRNWREKVPGPAGAVPAYPGYGYIFDVKHLYDVLKDQGIGATHSRNRPYDDLDELFIAHGLFADASPPDRSYTVNEEVGRAAHMGFTLGGIVVDADPTRRDLPTTPGSYVAYDAQDAVTGQPVAVQSFLVDVQFEPPFEHYSFSFQADPGATPGELPFHAPSPQYQASIYLTAKAPGWISSQPLVVTSDDYHTQMEGERGDYFVQHTFEMEPVPAVFVPLVQRSTG